MRMLVLGHLLALIHGKNQSYFYTYLPKIATNSFYFKNVYLSSLMELPAPKNVDYFGPTCDLSAFGTRHQNY